MYGSVGRLVNESLDNMKNITIVAIILASVTLLAVDRANTPDKSKYTAEAKKHGDLIIFVECEPINEYEQLGTVKLGIVGDCDWQVIREKLIKKAKKEYPEAHGLMIDEKLNGTAIKILP